MLVLGCEPGAAGSEGATAAVQQQAPYRGEGVGGTTRRMELSVGRRLPFGSSTSTSSASSGLNRIFSPLRRLSSVCAKMCALKPGEVQSARCVEDADWSVDHPLRRSRRGMRRTRDVAEMPWDERDNEAVGGVKSGECNLRCIEPIAATLSNCARPQRSRTNPPHLW